MKKEIISEENQVKKMKEKKQTVYAVRLIYYSRSENTQHNQRGNIVFVNCEKKR